VTHVLYKVRCCDIKNLKKAWRNRPPKLKKSMAQSASKIKKKHGAVGIKN
jgi:hypothetical protein